MCNYCEDMKSIFWCESCSKSPIREVYIEPDKTMTISANFGTEDGNESQNIKISYCPMCGKRLQDKEETSREEAP